MASTLPLPLRVAAGLIAAGLDHVRTLPQDIPGLSVTLAGRAMRASMRVQQEIADLANRGDELLAPFVERPEEHPAWAHFDDEPAAEGQDSVISDVISESDADGDSRGTPSSDNADINSERSEYDDVLGADPASETADPAPIPGYDELRVTGLRARLHGLDADTVAALLDYEQSTRARAAFVTLLGNRLATMRAAGRDTGGDTARGSGGGTAGHTAGGTAS
ncbi:MAG: hypothetical protein BGO26_15320 [Actinobacteria bacterium 69-20]|jgi:hypothetical protein|nr:lipid droplet-associated protein [Actinomycetota bacterium]OJV28693.1 MAG: hypothetical protein BGO26_15320 [Actinobacteria bacterium 69-20]